MNTFNDIKTDVINKLGIATTSAYYTDAILNEWIRGATRWATSFKKWPMTEGRVSTTFVTEEMSFEGYKADSFRIVDIDGKRLQKLNFEDYQIFKEEEPNATDRVFSDFGRLVFVNPNIDLSGTLTAYGQYSPVAIDVTDTTATTIFSNGNEEGNLAIVDETIAYAKMRDQKATEAEFYHARAVATLEGMSGLIDDEQFNYKTHRTRGGMWQRINVVDSGVGDTIKRDQFLY